MACTSVPALAGRIPGTVGLRFPEGNVELGSISTADLHAAAGPASTQAHQLEFRDGRLPAAHFRISGKVILKQVP